VDFYQITRENNSLIIKIGTFMDKKQLKKYGLKYNFALTINENTDSGLEGLPLMLEHQILKIFKKEEIMNDPELVLQCILEGEITQKGEYVLPNQDFKNNLLTCTIREEDPALEYKILRRLAGGAVGTVFLSKRISDGKEFAIKRMAPKNKAQYEAIKGEIALMRHCRQDDGILQCYDAFDHGGKLWLVMELMDLGAFTGYCEDKNVKIEEKVIAYIMRKCLEGLLFLH
jgi:serine/threonine protein kinase